MDSMQKLIIDLLDLGMQYLSFTFFAIIIQVLLYLKPSIHGDFIQMQGIDYIDYLQIK